MIQNKSKLIINSNTTLSHNRPIVLRNKTTTFLLFSKKKSGTRQSITTQKIRAHLHFVTPDIKINFIPGPNIKKRLINDSDTEFSSLFIWWPTRFFNPLWLGWLLSGWCIVRNPILALNLGRLVFGIRSVSFCERRLRYCDVILMFFFGIRLVK